METNINMLVLFNLDHHPQSIRGDKQTSKKSLRNQPTEGSPKNGRSIFGSLYLYIMASDNAYYQG